MPDCLDLIDCSCAPCNCNNRAPPNACSTTARIRRRVRMPMSLWVSRRSTLNISGFGPNALDANNTTDPFSGPSDRSRRSLNTITNKRGVDKKHNSYARYLGRKKAPVLRSNMKYSAAGKICSTSCCGSVAAPDPRPDYAIQPSSNIDGNGVITVEIKNIGGSPAGAVYSWFVGSFHRIFEVTTDIDKAAPWGSYCPKETPFFVNGQSYYQTNNTGNLALEVNMLAPAAGNFQSYSVWISGYNPGGDTLQSSPRLAPNDSIKFTIEGTGFNSNSMYMFSADDTVYYSHCNGDETNEIIEDTDNPSNNFFVFTTNGNGAPFAWQTEVESE